MIKNRTLQLIFQTVYCTLGMVGSIACLGIFDNVNMIRWDFYVHFTNICNFLCLGVMTAALIQTAKKKEDSYVSVAPFLKFISMVGTVLAFLVFNLLLANAADRDPQLNWRIGSICFHIVLPILSVADWFLFYERGKIKWFYPLFSAVFPFAYIFLLFLQAVILKFDTSILIPGTKTPLIYPYFFIDLDTQGIGGAAKWVLIILLTFAAIGFVFYGIDKFGKKRNS